MRLIVVCIGGMSINTHNLPQQQRYKLGVWHQYGEHKSNTYRVNHLESQNPLCCFVFRTSEITLLHAQ